MHIFPILIVGLGVAFSAACGDDGDSSRNRTIPEGNGAGGEGGGGNTESCSLDQPGDTFSFVIENGTDSDVSLFLGCGELSPIELETDHGLLGLGAENAEVCGYGCESIYDGAMNNSCSDCGSGSSALLAPGSTETIEWDRRVFRSHTAPAECSGHDDDNECALGVRVDTEVDSGVLSYCAGETPTGSCDDERELEFAIDLDEDELTIVIE